jgi:pyroglutamyl-peptidase
VSVFGNFEPPCAANALVYSAAMLHPIPLPTPAHPLTAPCVLLTGFDPFGGMHANPSWQAVQALAGRVIAGHRVIAAQLPTEFGTSLRCLDALLLKHRPALVLCTGQASSRSGISIERVAINVDDARIPDNVGYQPVDMQVETTGPAAYFSTLPIKAMLRALQQESIAAEISQTAGTFVCNHVFYGLMHRLATLNTLNKRVDAPVRGGFIHVPALPEQVKDPAHDPHMPLRQIVQGLRVAVQAALTHTTDVALVAGALD